MKHVLAALAVLCGVLGASSDVWAGSLSVEKPWARATAGQAANGAAYLTVVNVDGADRLVSVASPVAATVELHTHINEDGVMRMRPVPGIEIPAGGRAVLEPGGFHIMLIGLKGPLKEGRRIPLTLTFEKAGIIETEAVVLGAGARGPN